MSCDIGKWAACFDSCQLTITWTSNNKLNTSRRYPLAFVEKLILCNSPRPGRVVLWLRTPSRDSVDAGGRARLMGLPNFLTNVAPSAKKVKIFWMRHMIFWLQQQMIQINYHFLALLEEKNILSTRYFVNENFGFHWQYKLKKENVHLKQKFNQITWRGIKIHLSPRVYSSLFYHFIQCCYNCRRENLNLKGTSKNLQSVFWI